MYYRGQRKALGLLNTLTTYIKNDAYGRSTRQPELRPDDNSADSPDNFDTTAFLSDFLRLWTELVLGPVPRQPLISALDGETSS